MMSEPEAEACASANSFTAADVAAILHERGWIRSESDDVAAGTWMAEAAALLGPRAANREALAHLLSMVFDYDAHTVLALRECQEVLTREGARAAVRSPAPGASTAGAAATHRLPKTGE